MPSIGRPIIWAAAEWSFTGAFIFLLRFEYFVREGRWGFQRWEGQWVFRKFFDLLTFQQWEAPYEKA